MPGLLRKLFNIYPGEEKNAFLFACLGFLWALAVTAGLKFADALFLIHIGADSLPTVYILNACGMILLATVLLRAFHIVSIYHIFVSVILTGAVFYLFAYFCFAAGVGTDSSWLWFVLKIFGSLFFSVVVTAFWTFIDQYHHLQDAKRLYSLFTSMIFLGIATTGAIMHAGLIDFKHLTIGIVALLLFTSFWIRKISREVTPVHDENEFEGMGGLSTYTFRFLIQSILKSRFTLLLMAGNFMTYLLLVITEYNYLSAFDHHFDPTHTRMAGGEEDAHLTLFLGQLIAIVSMSNLIFGLFVYSRIVRRFGSSSLVPITPAILLVTFGGWQLSDSLIFPILGFFVVEGTLYVIDDSNFNLLLNGVPSKLKYKIRVMIESFFEPVGMLISATLISVPWIDSKLLGLILAGGAFVVALILKKQYFKAIYLNLADNAIHFQKSLQDWFNGMSPKEQTAAAKRLLKNLQHGNPLAQIAAAEGLLAFEDSALLKKLLVHGNIFSSSQKITLLNLIGKSCFCTDSQVLDLLHKWAYDDNYPQVKSAIHFYLARHGLLHPEKALLDLKSSDLTLRGAAIISLKKSWAYLSPTTAALNRSLAAQMLQHLLDSDEEDEICMGLTVIGVDSNPHDIDILIPFLKNHSLKIARAAAGAVAKIIDRQAIRHAPLLLSELASASDSDIRISCLNALGKIADTSLVKPIISASTHFRPSERRVAETVISKIGLRTVPTLLAITKDAAMNDRCRLLAGRILGHLALPQLRANLYEIICSETERANFYYYYNHTIQDRYPEIDLRMLSEALLSGYYSVLDFIIQLLGVAGEIEDCELLSRSLRSRNLKLRSQVVETLEKTCEIKIFRIIQPLVLELPREEKIRGYIKNGRTPLSLNELLDKMSMSSAQLDQIIAAAFKHRLNLPHWRESLRKQMLANDEIFHHFAYELLET
jgi:HEAT repeat protein